jgi:probable DNA metabolism protein
MNTPTNYQKYLRLHELCTHAHLAYAKGKSARDVELATDSMGVTVRNMVSSVRREAHMLRGFVRFTAIGEYVLYGYLNPRHAVGPMVAELLAHRYPHHVVVLGNAYRSWLALYTRSGYHHSTGQSLNDTIRRIKEVLGQDGEERSVNDVWELYYESQNREERRNLPYFQKNMTKTLMKSARNTVEKNTNGATLDPYLT